VSTARSAPTDVPVEMRKAAKVPESRPSTSTERSCPASGARIRDERILDCRILFVRGHFWSVSGQGGEVSNEAWPLPRITAIRPHWASK
jgi:hypothetical protein